MTKTVARRGLSYISLRFTIASLLLNSICISHLDGIKTMPHPLPDEDRNGPRGASLSNGINLRQQNCIVFSRQLLKLRGDLKNAQTKGFFIN
jgi:hypothetical protein